MILRPGVNIKKEIPEEESIFIIEDNNVSWVRQGANELYCSVPDGWVGEVVAIIIQKYDRAPGNMLMTGVFVGKTKTDVCKLDIPTGGLISAEDAAEKIKEGTIIYNGSNYKLA